MKILRVIYAVLPLMGFGGVYGGDVSELRIKVAKQMCDFAILKSKNQDAITAARKDKNDADRATTSYQKIRVYYTCFKRAYLKGQNMLKDNTLPPGDDFKDFPFPKFTFLKGRYLFKTFAGGVSESDTTRERETPLSDKELQGIKTFLDEKISVAKHKNTSKQQGE